MAEHVFETVETDGVVGVVVDGSMVITGVTAQREEVVRCRDCKHAITSYTDGLPRCAGPLVMEATLVPADCFCAWGERP